MSTGLLHTYVISTIHTGWWAQHAFSRPFQLLSPLSSLFSLRHSVYKYKYMHYLAGLSRTTPKNLIFVGREILSSVDLIIWLRLVRRGKRTREGREED